MADCTSAAAGRVEAGASPRKGGGGGRRGGGGSHLPPPGDGPQAAPPTQHVRHVGGSTLCIVSGGVAPTLAGITSHAHMRTHTPVKACLPQTSASERTVRFNPVVEILDCPRRQKRLQSPVATPPITPPVGPLRMPRSPPPSLAGPRMLRRHRPLLRAPPNALRLPRAPTPPPLSRRSPSLLFSPPESPQSLGMHPRMRRQAVRRLPTLPPPALVRLPWRALTGRPAARPSARRRVVLESPRSLQRLRKTCPGAGVGGGAGGGGGGVGGAKSKGALAAALGLDPEAAGDERPSGAGVGGAGLGRRDGGLSERVATANPSPPAGNAQQHAPAANNSNQTGQGQLSPPPPPPSPHATSPTESMSPTHVHSPRSTTPLPPRPRPRARPAETTSVRAGPGPPQGAEVAGGGGSTHISNARPRSTDIPANRECPMALAVTTQSQWAQANGRFHRRIAASMSAVSDSSAHGGSDKQRQSPRVELCVVRSRDGTATSVAAAAEANVGGKPSTPVTCTLVMTNGSGMNSDAALDSLGPQVAEFVSSQVANLVGRPDEAPAQKMRCLPGVQPRSMAELVRRPGDSALCHRTDSRASMLSKASMTSIASEGESEGSDAKQQTIVAEVQSLAAATQRPLRMRKATKALMAVSPPDECVGSLPPRPSTSPKIGGLKPKDKGKDKEKEKGAMKPFRRKIEAAKYFWRNGTARELEIWQYQNSAIRGTFSSDLEQRSRRALSLSALSRTLRSGRWTLVEASIRGTGLGGHGGSPPQLTVVFRAKPNVPLCPSLGLSLPRTPLPQMSSTTGPGMRGRSLAAPPSARTIPSNAVLRETVATENRRRQRPIKSAKARVQRHALPTTASTTSFQGSVGSHLPSRAVLNAKGVRSPPLGAGGGAGGGSRAGSRGGSRGGGNRTAVVRQMPRATASASGQRMVASTPGASRRTSRTRCAGAGGGGGGAGGVGSSAGALRGGGAADVGRRRPCANALVRRLGPITTPASPSSSRYSVTRTWAGGTACTLPTRAAPNPLAPRVAAAFRRLALRARRVAGLPFSPLLRPSGSMASTNSGLTSAVSQGRSLREGSRPLALPPPLPPPPPAPGRLRKLSGRSRPFARPHAR